MTTASYWIARHASERGSHPALISAEGTLSYAELDDAARSLAAKLHGLGIATGDRVAVLLENDPLYVVLIHALVALGAVLVPLNVRLTPRELRELLVDAEPRLLLHGTSLASVAAESVRDLRGIRTLPAPALHTLSEKPVALPVQLRLDADQAILFTSGTSGRPKGVRLGLAQHLASAAGSAERLGIEHEDRWLACMPLYHIGGLAIVLRSALYGISVVLHSDFDARAVLHSLQHDRISAVSLVPTMLARLLDASGDAQFPASLRFVLLGGGPIPTDLVLRARRARVPVAASYGLTEAASQVATLAPAEDEAHVGSVGQALPGVELRIVDENGRDQPAEVAGEICVRAAQVMSGYLNLPEQTTRTLEAGWLHTGDIGTLSTEGYLTLLDRRSDLIVSGGENVSPAEVEAVLLCHPDVAAAAVVGRSDPSWGQVVHAFVVPRAARVASTEELIAHCRSRLAGFKLPRVIELVTSLPQTKPGRLRRETWKAKS